MIILIFVGIRIGNFKAQETSKSSYLVIDIIIVNIQHIFGRVKGLSAVGKGKIRRIIIHLDNNRCLSLTVLVSVGTDINKNLLRNKTNLVFVERRNLKRVNKINNFRLFHFNTKFIQSTFICIHIIICIIRINIYFYIFRFFYFKRIFSFTH